MYHVGRDELAHARWKSRRLLAVVSLSFGVGEIDCSQGTSPIKTAYFAEQLLCSGALLNNSTALRGSIDFDDV